MPNLRAIHSVGDSLVNYLRRAYPAEMQQRFPCDFNLVSSNELSTEAGFEAQATLFLYRVSINPHTRNQSPRDPLTRRYPALRLDLHYLLSIWQDNAFTEQVVFGWVLQQLNEQPVLDLSLLSPDAEWAADDSIQLTLADLSHEEMFRIWDGLRPSYRLSVGYVARVIQIDASIQPDSLPVVAARFTPEPSKEPFRP